MQTINSYILHNLARIPNNCYNLWDSLLLWWIFNFKTKWDNYLNNHPLNTSLLIFSSRFIISCRIHNQINHNYKCKNLNINLHCSTTTINKIKNCRQAKFRHFPRCLTNSLLHWIHSRCNNNRNLNFPVQISLLLCNLLIWCPPNILNFQWSKIYFLNNFLIRC